MSKLFKDCMFKCIGSIEVMTKPIEFVNHRQPLNLIKVSILCCLVAFLRGFEWEAGIPGSHVDFLSKGYCSWKVFYYTMTCVKCSKKMTIVQCIRYVRLPAPVSTVQKGFKLTQIYLVFTACIPIWYSKKCLRTIIERDLWHKYKFCAEKFVRINTRLWKYNCLHVHPDLLS